ncbi:MAG: hypothetical protein M1815_003879 [Lichina confinis]|nr:MAG: hypothetical protein M1815_003879 [Lichina confinis]
MEKLINERFCMDGNRPSPGKNPVGNAGIERQLKRTRRRDEKAGTGFVPKRKGPKRRTKGSITTEDDIVQQGASRNDANSLPLLKNLWSRVSSGMTKYFSFPGGNGERDGGQGAGMGLSRGGGLLRPVPGPGLGLGFR